MKKCKLCGKRINERERYVYMEDWNNKKLEAANWFHLKCFTKGMDATNNAQYQQAQKMLDKANEMLNSMGFGVPQEYVVK